MISTPEQLLPLLKKSIGSDLKKWGRVNSWTLSPVENVERLINLYQLRKRSAKLRYPNLYKDGGEFDQILDVLHKMRNLDTIYMGNVIFDRKNIIIFSDQFDNVSVIRQEEDIII